MPIENNPFSQAMVSLASIATDCEPIVPSDSTNLPSVAIALRIGLGGTLHIETAKGLDRTIQVADGETLSVGVRKVFSSGTTASQLIAFYL